MGKITIATLVSLAVCSIYSACAADQDQASKLKNDFETQVRKLAKQKNISEKTLDDWTFETALREPRFVHAGLGPVNEDVFIEPQEPLNKLWIKGKPWSGLSSSQSQAVYIRDGKVTDTPSGSCDDLVLILFCPKDVQFIDFKQKRAGVYPRSGPSI